MRSVLGPLLLMALIASTFFFLKLGRHLQAPALLPVAWAVEAGCMGRGVWELRQSGVFLHVVGAQVGGGDAVIRGRMLAPAADAALEGASARLDGEVQGGACEGAVVSGQSTWIAGRWRGAVSLSGCGACPQAELIGEAQAGQGSTGQPVGR